MPFLGSTTQGAGSSNCSTDRALVSRTTAPEDGTIIGAQCYFAATSSGSPDGAKVILLTSVGDAPATVVAVSSGSAIPAGGGLATYSMSGSFSAGEVFVGIVQNSFVDAVSTTTGLSGVDTELANGTFNYATPPSSWPGTDVTYDFQIVDAAIEYQSAIVPELDQYSFRLRNDDGSESAATWIAAQDTVAAVLSGVNFRLRVQVNATLDTDPTDYQLEYYDAGVWTAVNTSTGPVILSPSSFIGSGGTDATTAQLTAPSGKTTSDFTAGEISDDTNPLPAIEVADDFYTEVEFCLKFTSSAQLGRTYTFRLTDAGAALGGYTSNVQVTVSNGSANVFLLVA